MNEVMTFPGECRRWRHQRKLSQLELSLRANVSQRHVSWLERGKSSPSREMVLRLAEAMDLPLRAQNELLQAAGFAPMYRESGLDTPDMTPVQQAIDRILSHHEPLPALVVDRLWRVQQTNAAADRLFSLVGDIKAVMRSLNGDDQLNLALLTLHPDGIRPLITNWDQAAPAFLRRLRQECLDSGDAERIANYEYLYELAQPMPEVTMPALLPVVPLELNVNGLRLSLFSVISTLGTPQDITTDELRIETFYPNDETTAALFTQN